MKNFNNLSKLFRYVNDNGDSVTFDYAGGYLIAKPTGIDTLTVSLSKATGINQVGATIQSRNVQPRAVNITGRLVGDNQANGKDILLGVVRPDIGGKLYAEDYYLDVYPTATPAIEAEKIGAKFTISLLAPYPYWCRDDSVESALESITACFRFPWAMWKAYRFGEVTETQFFNVINRGQVPVPFRAVFTASGEVVKPKITNAVTGKYMRINKTLAAGEVLTVDITHDRTNVTSTIDGECRGALDLKNTLYELDVGDNVLKPEAESGKDNLRIDIRFATEIVGIAL
jgi:phage-related protein